MMLPTKFRFIWPSGYRGEDFLLISKQSFPLKLLGQMNRNFVGSIYGRSSIKIANLVLFS
jgi:hypothetical protein